MIVNETVEDYLDALLGALRGRPREVRRALSEVEAHLYDAVGQAIAGGLDEARAGEQAVQRFGRVADVSAELNRATPRPGARDLLRRLVEPLAALTGIGLIAVGASGVLARVMTALWGRAFVFADPVGTRYPAAACRHWEQVHPGATSCTRAYVAEAMADGLLIRYVAGVVGLGIVGVLLLMARRHRAHFAASAMTPVPTVVGAVAFLVAGLALLALGIDRVQVAAARGAGRWLSGAAVALLLGVVFAVALIRNMRRYGVPDWTRR